MAAIIKFDEIMKERFYKWAEGYLQSNAGKSLDQYPIEHILCTLIEKNILSLEQIRAELKMRKIMLHESYFEKALWLIEEMKKDQE
ncbi:MAG: hypothetical protein IKB02_09885 [Clostridia bacterium]|nr:hypothetical protein [Clostridia bacterium]MBR2389043.1 hypothetical protein [Clostridia bacterium]